MQATARRSWRNRPEYQGHVADGWYLDSAGRLRFQPDPRIDLARARLTLLEMDLPPAPVVIPVAIGGRMPRPENVAAIRQAVDSVPLRFRCKWMAAGGRCEVIAGNDARCHPAYRGTAPAIGFCHLERMLCVVAADSGDALHTAIHEIGHALDHLLHVSQRAEWRDLWRRELAADNVPSYTRQRSDPAEFFAESFSRLYSPSLYPNDRAADFIKRLQT